MVTELQAVKRDLANHERKRLRLERDLAHQNEKIASKRAEYERLIREEEAK